jgi:hypothetical protein
MAFSTQSTRDVLRTIEGRWPWVPDDAWREAVAARLDALLGATPPPVADRLIKALLDPTQEPVVRTAVSALQIANTLGLRPIGWLGEDRLHLLDPQGRPLALGLVGVDVPSHAPGSPETVTALTAALDQAFGERRYVIWLRRALAPEIDTEAIGRAVTLWLAAIDRGEWQGNHAVYEDAGVELELVLTGDTGRTGDTSLALRIDPIVALERLSTVDSMLVDRASAHDESAGDIPLIFAVGATGPWRLPRGFAEQLLYGTADWTRANTDPQLYEAAFPATGRSLFGDPLSSNIAAVWWVEPDGDDPLNFRCWSHENPWARCAWTPEPAPGPRFHRVSEGKGSKGRVVDLMRWSEKPPRSTR